ncbi:MAG: hypothetical protein HY713_09390 [candidate division NC10 bacterium]|nr:hypothetical protein [candidate division NC10 bacterium]
MKTSRPARWLGTWLAAMGRRRLRPLHSGLKLERGALKKGAMVKATYEEKGGQKVATSIEVWPEERKPKS